MPAGLGRFRRPARGRFTTPTSRTGRGFTYGGRRFGVGGERFQLEWNGPQVLGEITEALVDTLAELTDLGEANLEAITPYDSGYLLSTTFCDLFWDGQNRIVIQLGAEAYYAIYVEMGTSKMRAQPFIRPTLDLLVSRLVPTYRAQLAQRQIA